MRPSLLSIKPTF